jgi:signal recognition particle receptor subunit beta
VLVDTRRIEDCFPAIDYFEQLGIPFVVGINCFEGAPLHAAEEVREALGVQAPVILMDARERVSVKKTLKRLLEHAISQTAIAGPTARR